MSDDREKCVQAGCTDYLTKPLDTELLLKAVGRYLPQIQRAQPVIGNEPATAPQSAGASPALAVPPGLIKSRFRGDVGMIEVTNQFVAALPGRVGELLRLLNSNNLIGLRSAVHRLKGAGGGYGFTPISELSAHALKLLEDDSNIGLARSAIQELVELIRRVEGYDRARETAELSTPAAA
jgi:hypothetical protein